MKKIVVVLFTGAGALLMSLNYLTSSDSLGFNVTSIFPHQTSVLVATPSNPEPVEVSKLKISPVFALLIGLLK
ncbi:MAG: hypothetical protein ACI9GM_001748 [Salibacteraceae bacterium]|jgi:hypothetical protein